MFTHALFFLTSILSSSLLLASSEREVRFWEGAMREDTSLEKHIEYIKNTLAPGTIVAGDKALEHYIVYLPSANQLPEDTYLEKLPFSEAAIPTYVNNAQYLEARAAHIEYGPLHFIENGFQTGLSYSASPIVYKGELRIASQNDKVAYDLRPYSLLTPLPSTEGLLKYEEPNWQKGTSLVWLELRKKEVSDEVYIEAANKLFSSFTSKKVSSEIDGHYAKIAKGHILHFINVTNPEKADSVLEEIKNFHEASFAEVLISYELLKAQNLAAFAPGWTDAFKASSAINVLFTR